MTIEEQRSELKNQIAYHQQELKHLRELREETMFGFMKNSQRCVLSLIASLQEQLSSLTDHSVEGARHLNIGKQDPNFSKIEMA
jgi:hypothetical protein